jgi:hypothetical protein
MWCIPPRADAEFVFRMEDVLEVYHRPYDPRRPVVCLDEASKPLIAEVRTPLPARRGRVERYDCEYARNGTANVFIAVEPLAGWRGARVTGRRQRRDWAAFVKDLVDERYAAAEKIVLVMDQLNTHSPASLYEAFDPAEAKRIADRLEIHHTPRHGSWLNMAEIELSALGRQCLAGRIADRPTLARRIGAWQAARTAAAVTVARRFTTADARIKLRKLYPSIDG